MRPSTEEAYHRVVRWLTFVLLGLGVASCLHPGDVPCGDHVCPQNTTCDAPTGLCVPALCGNDHVDVTEECDGTFADENCTDHGFYFPAGLACSPVCTLDTTECKGYCGDHAINGPETCDGIPPAGLACADFGFDVGQLGCSGSCTPAFSACAPVGWTSMPGGSTTELHAVASTSRTAVAVGLAGSIVQNVDGVWIPMASPTTQDLHGVWLSPGVGMAPDTGFAVGAGGTILRFDGTSWTTVPSGVTADLHAVSGVDASKAVAVGDGGTILELNGGSWVAATSGTAQTLRAVWAGALIAYAVGDAGTILVRQPNGTWGAPPVAFPYTVLRLEGVSAAGGAIFVAGAESVNTGFAARFQDGAWGQIPLVATGSNMLSAVYASTRTDVWFSGQTGSIIHWDGAHALIADTGTSRTILGICAIGPARAFAVTRGGEVLGYNGTSRSTQPYYKAYVAATAIPGGALGVGVGGGVLRFNGQNWEIPPNTSTNLPFTANMTTVFADDARVLAGAAALQSGPTGGIFISTDGGATFSEVPTGSASVNGIAGAGGDYYAVADGKIHESTNGTTWAQVASPPATLFGVWGLPDGSAFFAVGVEGGLGTIYRGKGATWTKMQVPPGPRLNAVWGTSPSDIYAVGNMGTVHHYDGTHWRTMYTGTGENFVSVSGSSAQDVFVGGTNIRYHFDGVSWSRISNPAFRDTAAIVAGKTQTFFVGSFLGAEVFSRACAPTEERCEDPWDNDCDGLTNCADDDCKNALGCARGGACETSVRLECGTTISASTYTGIARIDDFPCLGVSTPGPEASFRFVGESNRQVTVTLAVSNPDMLADPPDDLELLVTSARPGLVPGAGSCDVQQCSPATATSPGRSLTFTEAQDELRYIVVDGPLSTARDFTLTVDCQ